ncbi:MAG: hypothetical protein Q4E62_04000 [Sutterellaceae bacterium]|nr:hypothetical protein [Sutterellaceae bacterium]
MRQQQSLTIDQPFVLDNKQTPAFVTRPANRVRLIRSCIARYSDKAGLFFTGEQWDEFDLQVMEELLLAGRKVEAGQTFPIDLKEVYRHLFPYSATVVTQQFRTLLDSLARIGNTLFEFHTTDDLGHAVLFCTNPIKSFSVNEISLSDLFVNETFFPDFGPLLQKACAFVDPALILRLVLASTREKDYQLHFDGDVDHTEFDLIDFPAVLEEAGHRLSSQFLVTDWCCLGGKDGKKGVFEMTKWGFA